MCAYKRNYGIFIWVLNGLSLLLLSHPIHSALGGGILIYKLRQEKGHNTAFSSHCGVVDCVYALYVEVLDKI